MPIYVESTTAGHIITFLLRSLPHLLGLIGFICKALPYVHEKEIQSVHLLSLPWSPQEFLIQYKKPVVLCSLLVHSI